MLQEIVNLITKTKLSLPVTELSLMIVALSLCLIFRASRTGLLVAFFFAYRWGWMFFAEHSEKFFVTYLVFGGIVCVLTVVNMLQKSPDK